jgi:type I restriction enzyme S subunit
VNARLAWAIDRARKGGLGRDERTSIIERDADLQRTIAERSQEEALPSTWRWCGLGEVFGVYVGATPSRGDPSLWHGEVPWVSSGEVAFCRVSTTEEKITAKGLANTSTRVHPRGTVLLGMIGEGKTRGQAAILDIEACNNQNCAAIRFPKRITPGICLLVSI